MLRYRESLGLTAPPRGGGGHREYGDRELRAASYSIELEDRYDVTPKALAFALRTLAETGVQADVRRLGQLSGRLEPSPIAALDFDQEKAQRLLGEAAPLTRGAGIRTSPGPATPVPPATGRRPARGT